MSLYRDSKMTKTIKIWRDAAFRYAEWPRVEKWVGRNQQDEFRFRFVIYYFKVNKFTINKQ